MFVTRKRNKIETILAFIFLAAALSLTASCGGSKKEKAVSGEDVKEEIMEAADTTAAFLIQEKENMIAAYRSRLETARDQINAYNAMVADAGDEMVAQYRRNMETLETASMETQRKIDTLISSSGSAWEELKEGAEMALDDLEQAIRDAKDQFSKSGE